MGGNPMQKMKRNSMLLGLTVGLVIGLILCVLVYLFLTQTAGVSLGSKEDIITVCILNKDIKAGTVVTDIDIIEKDMSIDSVPTDAVTLTTDAVAKIDLSAGTVLGASMLNLTEDTLTSDLREQEYNMISLPTQLEIGDFIDIRLQLPNGGDYIVVSKKQVLNCDATTVWINMYEEEIELMSNAIIEYYIMAGSKLYAVKYVEPGLQTASIGTYVPNQSVASLISSNPNIKNYINSERYADALKDIRNNYINSALNQYNETAVENLEKNMQEEIKTLKEAREEYFGVLDSESEE